jgi:WD40 repeat protein
VFLSCHVGLFYLGHDAQVNSVDFAHKSDLLISSSADATARIWKTGRVDSAVVVFSHKRHHPVKIGTTPSTGQSNPGGRRQQPGSRNTPFSGAILSASFYYLDKFALLVKLPLPPSCLLTFLLSLLACSRCQTSKTSVMMYSYDLEDLEQQDNDLKRLQATGKYKLVHEWAYDTAQSLTATSCLNSVESPTIITSSSDRYVFCSNLLSHASLPPLSCLLGKS